MTPKKLTQHQDTTLLFSGSLNDVKENLNPSIGQYRPITADTLRDAAESFERLYKNESMDIFSDSKFEEPANKRKLLVEIENLADAMLNDGLHPKTGQIIDMDTWFKTAEDLGKYVSKDYGTGAGNIITRQVVTRMIEKLEVEDTVYKKKKKKMSVRTNEEIILQ